MNKKEYDYQNETNANKRVYMQVTPKQPPTPPKKVENEETIDMLEIKEFVPRNNKKVCFCPDIVCI